MTKPAEETSLCQQTDRETQEGEIRQHALVDTVAVSNQSQQSPGAVVGVDLQVDAVHPQHEVAHHVEEAEFLHSVQQEEPACLTRLQQALPGGGDGVLAPVDVVGFLPGVGLLQRRCVVLHLVHLRTDRRRVRRREERTFGFHRTRRLSRGVRALSH